MNETAAIIEDLVSALVLSNEYLKHQRDYLVHDDPNAVGRLDDVIRVNRKAIEKGRETDA